MRKEKQRKGACSMLASVEALKRQAARELPSAAGHESSTYAREKRSTEIAHKRKYAVSRHQRATAAGAVRGAGAEPALR